MRLQALTYGHYWTVHQPFLRALASLLGGQWAFEDIDGKALFSLRSPLYWLSGKGELLYTLGPTSVLSAPLLCRSFKALLFVEEFWPKGRPYDGLLRHYLSTFQSPHCIFLAPSLYSYNHLRSLGLKAHLLPPLVENPQPSGKEEFFLWVGRPEGIKRPFLLLEIASLMPEERFVVVGMEVVGKRGDRAILEEFLEKVKALPNVEVMGRVKREELFSLYRRAKALLSTSYAESGGAPVAEALAFATPAFATSLNAASSFLPRKWVLSPNASAREWVERLSILSHQDRQEALSRAERFGIVWRRDRYRALLEELKELVL